MATFYISGIWKSAGKTGKISHVLLHKANGRTAMGPGHKFSKEDVASFINAGHQVVTRHWSYEKGSWITGKAIQVEYAGKEPTLHSLAGVSNAEQLEQLMNYEELINGF